VLLDSGSELSERCVQALGLARSPSRILVTGISSIQAETTRGCSTLDLQSRISDYTMKVWTVFTGQKMFDNQGNIIAISTIFGWVIISIVTAGCSSTTTMHMSIDIDASLQRFWELEDVNQKFHGKPEDDKVEQHFVKTHTRDSKRRCIVELPFKNSKEQVSDTLQGALTIFSGVGRRLMRDYLQLRHMRDPEDIYERPSFYLPHHSLITQKLLVVFDGSHKDGVDEP